MIKESVGSINILSAVKQEKIIINPIVQNVHVHLAAPSMLDNRADADRIRDYLKGKYGRVRIPYNSIRAIPEKCREFNWDFNVLLKKNETGWELLKFFAAQAENKLRKNYGLAVDIGTTTVVVALIDMETGMCLGTSAGYNGQVYFAEDILSRIYFASDHKGLCKLQAAIKETLNALIDDVCSKCCAFNEDITAVTVGANTVMLHFLLGLDTSRISREPYTPVINNTGFLTAEDVGINVHPKGVLYCLPSVGSYIGGDVLAGILVSNMHEREGISLLVDIGTNGEIILGNSDWLVACAGAAGPALEGGVVAFGMRAEVGAIEKVSIKPCGEVVYKVIGDVKPKGICGSGLVDCLSEMLLNGIIDRSGRFTGGADYFTVVPAALSANGQPIVVTQVDVKNILRTKGAVNAAVEVLLEGVGCNIGDIEYFFSAGAFGRFLDIESAVNIGLYPDLPRDRMTQLGNSSLEGARQVLLSIDRLLEAEKIATRITYFELNSSQEFMNKFVGSKFFPHTNLDYYPTVRDRLKEKGL